MTTLPSFVELMASLGINAKATEQPEPECVSTSTSPSHSPKLLNVPAQSLRSKSSPSLRDQASRTRSARYSPYASTFISGRRRGSVSSVSSSSSSDNDDLSERSSSCSPTLRSSSRTRRRGRDKLIVNVFGSSTDLSANTPISTYVRRKTPGTSPSSPSFPRETVESREFSKPFIIPTLPPFLPRSPGSDSFPVTPKSDSLTEPLSSYGLKQVSDVDVDIMSRRSHLHTGIRISTPPRLADSGEKAIHHFDRVLHVS